MPVTFGEVYIALRFLRVVYNESVSDKIVAFVIDFYVVCDFVSGKLN